MPPEATRNVAFACSDDAMSKDQKTAWRPANRGSAIKESDKGLLYLEFSEWRVTALRPEPAVAWVKSREDARWRGAASPDVHLGELIRHVRAEDTIESGVPRTSLPKDDRPPMRPYETRRRKNFRRFLEPIPNEVQNELTKRFPHNDWPLFRLLLKSAYAREACATGDRALVFALTAAPVLIGQAGRRRADFANRWLKRGRRQAVARLRFPERPLSLKVLRRLKLEHADVEVLCWLREVLHEPESAKLLAHLPGELTAAQVACCHPSRLARLNMSFLHDVGAVKDRWNANAIVRVLEDCKALEEQFDCPARPIFSSRESLKFHHGRLVERARKLKLASGGRFPPPPVDLSPDELRWATPLLTGAALVNEGEKMHHCLGNLTMHHELAHRGRFFAWAIHGDERATVALIRTADQWELYDARGFANGPIGTDLRRWVKSVVLRARASVGYPPAPHGPVDLDLPP